MITLLLPYFTFYKSNKFMLTLGIVLIILTMLASILMFSISGWFLSVSAIVETEGIYSFNYIVPAVVMRCSAIIRTLGRYFERLVSHDATFRVLQHLRVFTFSKLLPLSPSKLKYFSYGELLNNIVADIDTLNNLYLRVISPLLGSFIVLIIITVALSLVDIQLSLILSSIMLLTFFMLQPLFYFFGKSNCEKLSYLYCEYRKKLISWLHCQAELTIFGANKRYRAHIDNTEQKLHEAQYYKYKLTVCYQALMIIITGFAVIVILWITSALSNVTGALIALFVFCTIGTFQILGQYVTGTYHYLVQVIASLMRIKKITEQEPEVKFHKNIQQSTIKIVEQVALNIKNISFSYDDRQQLKVIDNISLLVNKGMHVAIIGRTGCGKSTLLQLLTRAWDPNKGEIKINNINLKNFSEYELRKIVSLVPQKVHIFSATLRDNLLIASPNSSDETLISVLKKVGLQNFIEKNCLNIWLGEGGRQISGGETRRLAIARALLHNAPLMLLDEPTEGLDYKTEKQIMLLLKEVMQDKTVLMVTHRFIGIEFFDKIIVMDNGHIIKQGTHASFLACTLGKVGI